MPTPRDTVDYRLFASELLKLLATNTAHNPACPQAGAAPSKLVLAPHRPMDKPQALLRSLSKLFTFPQLALRIQPEVTTILLDKFEQRRHDLLTLVLRPSAKFSTPLPRSHRSGSFRRQRF